MGLKALSGIERFTFVDIETIIESEASDTLLAVLLTRQTKAFGSLLDLLPTELMIIIAA